VAKERENYIQTDVVKTTCDYSLKYENKNNLGQQLQRKHATHNYIFCETLAVERLPVALKVSQGHQ